MFSTYAITINTAATRATDSARRLPYTSKNNEGLDSAIRQIFVLPVVNQLQNQEDGDEGLLLLLLLLLFLLL